jgi:putative tricarboxylic transport membrane protein
VKAVAGPEAANNATVTMAMIPLLTCVRRRTPRRFCWAHSELWRQPGPRLFTTSSSLVWAL